MKILATGKSEQNEAALDPWTLIHFSTGLALGLMEVPPDRAYGAAVAYEIVEQYVERAKWGQDLFESDRPETAINALVDLAAFGVGHWLGGQWNRSDG